MIEALAGLLPPLASERRASLWFPFVLPGLTELLAARGKPAPRAYGQARGTLYDEIKRREQANVAAYAMMQRRRGSLMDFDGRARLFIACNWREPDKKRDPDNIVGGGKKILLDALGPSRIGSRGWVGASLIHCDGQHCVQGFLDVVTVGAWPGIAVHIFEITRPVPWALPDGPLDLRP